MQNRFYDHLSSFEKARLGIFSPQLAYSQTLGEGYASYKHMS
jgi:hypothetical protein